MRLFEQNHMTICYVYPALKKLKRHLEQQKHPPNADAAECLDYWLSIVSFIRVSQRKLFDMDLVKIAFWLTSFGCTLLAQQQKLIPESHQFRLQYEGPLRTIVSGPMDAIIGEAGRRPMTLKMILPIPNRQATVLRKIYSKTFQNFKKR
jgi:hypothetical protein